MMKPQFTAGRNMAMKVPDHQYDQTLAFYRQVLGLDELTPAEPGATPRFAFGDKVLWLDRVTGISQAELWLEVVTDDLALAADYLARQADCRRCDAIEPLPEGFQGFWLTSPANLIHLIAQG